MDVIEKAGTMYEDGTIERCVGFVFSKRMSVNEAFEPQVRQAMQEYLAAKSVRQPFSNEPDPDDGFVASNGVTVSLAIFDAAGAMAEQTDPIVEHMTEDEVVELIGLPSQGFGPEEYEIAEAEARQIANAKPNPSKVIP